MKKWITLFSVIVLCFQFLDMEALAESDSKLETTSTENSKLAIREENKDGKRASSVSTRVRGTIASIFPDPILANGVVTLLGKSSTSDVVDDTDFNKVTGVLVNFSSLKVKNAEGMQNFTNITGLYASDWEISDVSPLAGLVNLQTLALTSSSLKDISPLSSLTKLENLFLGAGEINNVSPLSGLVNMTGLYINNNKISDVSPLANMKNLKYLYLNNNEISDITPLASLVKMEDLQLNNNKISDISSLSKMTSIQSLEVLDQEISLPAVNWSKPLSITNSIKNVNGNIVAPSITSGQAYSGGKVIWNNLSNSNQTITYNWGASGFTGKATIAVKKTYKLIFDNDGKKTTQTLPVNNVAKEPAKPVKKGYTFTGWYDAKIGGKKWDFAKNKMPAKDVTLYARFTKTSNSSVGNNPSLTVSQGGTSNTDIDAKQKKTNSKSVEAASSQGNKVEKKKDNTLSKNLPKTGEENTNWLIIGLGFIMLVSGIVLTLFKRKELKD
ncbi:leucine-rich repeat domain-containing protein [Listeria monocytogenes]